MSVEFFFPCFFKANVGLKVTVWCNRKLNSSVLKTGAALASMLRFHHARLLCLMLVSKSLSCGCVSLFLFLQTLVFISKDSWDNYPQVFPCILSLKCSSVVFISWLWMQEGLGSRGVLLRSAFNRWPAVFYVYRTVHSPYKFWLSFCGGRENRIIWHVAGTFIGCLWVGMCL